MPDWKHNIQAPAELDSSDVEVLSDDTVYNGFFKMFKLRLKHKTFSGEWTEAISRELFHRGEAAAAILYDPHNDTIGLIEQFRVGALNSDLGPWCLEVVAGMMEQGEQPEGLIRRELEEEAGIDCADLRHISSYYSTPGGCSEKIHLYCAICNLEGRGGLFGLEQENEDIRFAVCPADEVLKGMYHSRANNAATLLGLQWLQIYRQELRSEIKD
ncbi:ADP-ribose pyrophosphatase [Alteromonadaceae bacterium Bs31]|nr:ADP-ribose pyrophosphatase [Alteromonadaceae bacterium Bs31]